jgi:hypothetical protein
MVVVAHHAVHLGAREIQHLGDHRDCLRCDMAEAVLHRMKQRYERPGPLAMGSCQLADTALQCALRLSRGDDSNGTRFHKTESAVRCDSSLMNSKHVLIKFLNRNSGDGISPRLGEQTAMAAHITQPLRLLRKIKRRLQRT